MIQKVRGTRDILDTTLFHFAITTIKKQIELYHFTHIELPILESVDLFKSSLGVETDVVSKEMFVVTSSSDQESESICLRPEGTAQTVRAFVENGIQTVPWKVFSIGQMFRYERPQKGRYRQFYQFNIECIGSAAIEQDVQIITMLDRLFAKKFRLENYTLHINFLGTQQERADFKSVLKIFLETLQGICDTCKIRKDTNILRVFDCKNPDCQTLYVNAPHLINHLGEQSQQEWNTLQERLQELSVSYIYNPRLVRGLDYYNKTVFEFTSPDLGAQSAFCGGGRYDTLVASLGGKQDQPSLGAAIGIDRVMLLLEMIQNNITMPHKPALYAIIPLDPAQNPLALQLADELIAHGLYTETFFEGAAKNMMKRANKSGATTCLIIGEQEQQDGTVVIKDMITGEQQIIKQNNAVSFLKGK
ncbi:histidine--tRNA ligase [Candidatus Babeliales bacterium]|nr:histidine--tRNA ligase [Candidatus Babeliales bacterium]